MDRELVKTPYTRKRPKCGFLHTVSQRFRHTFCHLLSYIHLSLPQEMWMGPMPSGPVSCGRMWLYLPYPFETGSFLRPYFGTVGFPFGILLGSCSSTALPRWLFSFPRSFQMQEYGGGAAVAESNLLYNCIYSKTAVRDQGRAVANKVGAKLPWCAAVPA